MATSLGMQGWVKRTNKLVRMVQNGNKNNRIIILQLNVTPSNHYSNKCRSIRYCKIFHPTHRNCSKLLTSFQRQKRFTVLQQHKTSHGGLETQLPMSLTLDDSGRLEFCIWVHRWRIEEAETHSCIEEGFDGFPHGRLIKKSLRHCLRDGQVEGLHVFGSVL